MDWYSVRCVIRLDGGAFEERITLWHAGSFDEATARAEAEVRDYCTDLECDYAGLAQAYRMDGPPVEGSEVFSLIRDSDLDAAEYVSRYFDTGGEYQREST